MEMKKTLAHIRQMHREVSKITREKERKCYEYLEDFVAVMSEFIDRLGLFPYHIAWECIYDKVPENLQVEEKFILRDAAKKENRNVPIIGSETFHYPKDRFFQPPLPRKDFADRFRNYFKNRTPTEVFEIPVNPDYSYFNLPVFSENETLPQWILTLICKEEESDSITGQDFFEILEHVSYEIGLGWDRFRENIANKLLKNIDIKLALMEKTRSSSTIDQLKAISGILAREINLEWCGFFLVNEQENKLKLETGNMNSEFVLDYSLKDSSNTMVNCFKEIKGLILFGRKSLENIVKPEKMKPIEKAIRLEKKQRKVKQGKQHFTPYILFEHALFHPISVREKEIGLLVLFRAKKTQKPEPEIRFEYITRPFSALEIHLIRKIRRYVLNILIFHEAVQERMKYINNVLDQVIGPIEVINSKLRLIPKGAGGKNTHNGDVDKIFRHVHALSRIASQYVKNFGILTRIDTGQIKPQKEKITDLRSFLIDLAILYTPLIQYKSLHIRVTDDTPNHINLEVDKELFGIVISNIIDNAIKYSFDRDDRALHGLQYQPKTMEDKENVLISAKEDNNFVIITISNYGIEINKKEKEKIYDRGFRGGHYQDRPAGTGIGLFLTRSIIEQHGGTIELVPDTPKHNTVFKITMPQKSAGNVLSPQNYPGNR